MADGMECPITFEAYEEKGDRQPLILPNCGHAFSRSAIRGLIEAQRARAAPGPSHRKGPTCQTPQSKVQQIDDCPPNWSVIQQIEAFNSQNPEQKEAAQRRREQEARDAQRRREEEKREAEIQQKAQADKLKQDKLKLELKEKEERLAAEREQERLAEEERQRAEAKAARHAAELARAEALLQEKKQQAAAAQAEAEKRIKDRGGKDKGPKAAKKSTGGSHPIEMSPVHDSMATESGPSTSRAADAPASHSTPEMGGTAPAGKSASADAPRTPDAQTAAEAQSSSKSKAVSGDAGKASTSAVAEAAASTASNASAEPSASSKAVVAPEGPRKVPKVLMKNRGAQLTKSDMLLNGGALGAPVAAIVERTLTPLLAAADCSTVSKALGALIVRDSKNAAAVLQAMTRKLTLLQLMSDHWKKLPTMGVQSLEDINKRTLERMHPSLCEHYSELMRIDRSKVTPDMVMNSAPGALQLVQLHIGAQIVDKMYASLTNCKGFDLEDDKNIPNTGDEGADAEELRMEKLQGELEDATATDTISGLCSDGEHILMPPILLKVASEVLMPRQGRFPMPEGAVQHILTDILTPRVHAALACGYNESVANKHAKRVASFICEHATTPDSALALHGSCISELPEVVDASLDHLVWSEPVAFSGLKLVEGCVAAAAEAAGGMHAVVGEGPSGTADDIADAAEATNTTAANSAAVAAAAASEEAASPFTPTEAGASTTQEPSKASSGSAADPQSVKDGAPSKGKKAGLGGFMRGFLGARPSSASSGGSTRPASATKPADEGSKTADASAQGEDGSSNDSEVPPLVDSSTT